MEKNIYKYAAENRIRFQSTKGSLCVEDLFVLSMTDLDKIYKALKVEERNMAEESLMDEVNKDSTVLGIKIEIVKDVYATKKTEKERRLEAEERRKQQQRIADNIDMKKDAALQDKSIEELEAMLNG
ncbi:MAG: hypothetical protein J6V44_05805 [Methanobrevibacter sp.]|nr:hypothetical protein [Methanobrevibacter sp.]